MLGGPGIINGEITMNGLGNAVAAVDEGVRNVNQSLEALSALVNSLKAELDQMNARVQNIERQVTPNRWPKRNSPTTRYLSSTNSRGSKKSTKRAGYLEAFRTPKFYACPALVEGPAFLKNLTF